MVSKDNEKINWNKYENERILKINEDVCVLFGITLRC